MLEISYLPLVTDAEGSEMDFRGENHNYFFLAKSLLNTSYDKND